MSSDAVDRRDMSHIRPLVGGPDPPLTHSSRNRVPYGHVIERMQVTGFHRWGLLILRATTNTEQAKWDIFLERIRASAERMMHTLPSDEATPSLLLPLLQWDVLEDREALEGAGVEAARRRFVEWRAGVSVERDGEGADQLAIRLGTVARFRYFVMVDDECLASLQEGQERDENSESKNPPVKVRVVDAGRPSGVDHLRGAFPEGGATAEVRQGQGTNDLTATDRDDDNNDNSDDEGDESDESGEEFPSVEGSTDWDVGWMWVEARFLLEFYDILQADSGWDHFYTRPPKVYGR